MITSFANESEINLLNLHRFVIQFVWGAVYYINLCVDVLPIIFDVFFSIVKKLKIIILTSTR